VICRLGEDRRTGRAVALPGWLDPHTVARAVAGPPVDVDGRTLAVLCRSPGPVHDRVGCITPTPSIRPRTALARAARSRGWTTPVDGRLAAARERLAAHEAGADAEAHGESHEARRHRRRLADASDEIQRLRERVATARGRVQAGSAATADDDGAADAGDESPDPLAAAVRDLTEAETAAAATREAHREARAAARRDRDRLQARLRLVDEVENLERAARRHLVERGRPAYEASLAAVPGLSTVPADPFGAPPDAMALAVARVAALAAPVVVAADRFTSADAAARWLGSPVIRLAP
jgi:hypothetical protein